MKTKLLMVLSLALIVLLTGCGFSTPPEALARKQISNLEARVSVLEKEIARLNEKLDKEIKKEVVVVKKEEEVVQDPIKLTGHFKFGRTKTSAEFNQELQKVADYIKKSDKKVVVTIKGYTDKKGDPKFNKWFSEKRAESTKAKIISLAGGADNVQFEIDGMGVSPDNQRKVEVTCQ
jgi:outer membrane protein OmpA-like peptidoglycan-associated protein